MGDTRIGRHGKKKRSFEKGARRATPRPPSVRASRSVWETVQRKMNANARGVRRVSEATSA